MICSSSFPHFYRSLSLLFRWYDGGFCSGSMIERRTSKLYWKFEYFFVFIQFSPALFFTHAFSYTISAVGIGVIFTLCLPICRSLFSCRFGSQFTYLFRLVLYRIFRFQFSGKCAALTFAKSNAMRERKSLCGTIHELCIQLCRIANTLLTRSTEFYE